MLADHRMAPYFSLIFAVQLEAICQSHEARKITKGGGLLLVTSKLSTEVARHQKIVRQQPFSLLFDTPTHGTSVMGMGGDIHLFVAQI